MIATGASRRRFLTGVATKMSAFLLAAAVPSWTVAEPSDVGAQFERGLEFEAGKDGKPNFAAAAEWYRRAANHGYAPAKVALGYLYQTGRGVPQDPSAAYKLYEEAARAGDLSGAFYLALAYSGGIGVNSDKQEAAFWLAKAAEGGDQTSQIMLALLLASYKSSTAEFAARRWLATAEKGSDPELASAARSAREKLDSKLLFSGAFSPEQILGAVVLTLGVAAILSAILPRGQLPYDPSEYDAPQQYNTIVGWKSSGRHQRAIIQRQYVRRR